MAATVSSRQLLSFEQENSIYLTDLLGSTPQKIMKGFGHSLSPDGNRIAYTCFDGDKRYAAVYEIATGVTTIYPAASSGNSFHPVFSPDGRFIAYHDCVHNGWRVAISDLASKEYTLLSDNGYTGGLFSPRWTPDGTSLLCHDLTNVLEFACDGTLLDSIALSQLVAHRKIGMASNCCVLYNKDRTALLFDTYWSFWEIDRHDEIGIFKFELATGRLSMLTPVEMICGRPWVDYRSGKIYFDGNDRNILSSTPRQAMVSPQWNIYVMDENGAGLSRIIANGNSPTVSQ